MEAFSEVRREESRKQVMVGGKKDLIKENQSQNSALVTKKNESVIVDQRGTKKGDRAWCDHCQHPYHTKGTCWKLHGKPANWKPWTQEEGRGFQANIEENKTVSSVFTKEQLDQLQVLISQSTQPIVSSTSLFYS